MISWKNIQKNMSGMTVVLLFVIALVLTPGFKHPEVKKNQQPPNVIVIVIDDAGYADFGLIGSKDLVTPNIDALAARSVLFTDAHVSATVCSPSRAGWLHLGLGRSGH